MNVTKIIMSILMLMLPLAGVAQRSVERVVLKNGTQFEGYIEKQELKYGNLSFKVMSSELVYPNEALDIDEEITAVDTANLDAEWKKWILTHSQYMTNQGDNKVVRFVNVRVKEQKKDLKNAESVYMPSTKLKVLVMEKGQNVRLKCMDEFRVTISQNDIWYVERLPNIGNNTSYLVDVIKTKDGKTYEGSLLRIYPGKEETLWVPSESSYVMLQIRDIAKEEKKANNQNYDIMCQTRYLDVVNTGEDVVTGIIINKDYERINDNSDYIEIVTEEKTEPTKILISSILSISKKWNDKYKELVEVSVGFDELNINKRQITLNKVPEDQLRISSINKVSIINDGESDGITITIAGDKSFDDITLLQLNGAEYKKGYYIIDWKELYEKSIKQSEVHTNKNGTCTADYEVDEGLYFIYDKKEKKCALIELNNNE